MIELTNILKRYQQHEVLRGVSLRVADGEVCVLLGPSGGGKSTLLRTIIIRTDNKEMLICLSIFLRIRC